MLSEVVVSSFVPHGVVSSFEPHGRGLFLRKLVNGGRKMQALFRHQEVARDAQSCAELGRTPSLRRSFCGILRFLICRHA